MSADSRRIRKSPAVITGVRASLPRELPPPLGIHYSDTIRINNQYKTPSLTP